MQKDDQLQEDYELQLAFQHNLTLKTVLPEVLEQNKSEEMGNPLSQTPRNGPEISRDITADPLDATNQHKNESDEPNTSKETSYVKPEWLDQLLSDELKILYEYIDAVGEKIDTITTFISTFVDDELLGSQQDPHFCNQAMMRGIMSDDSLEP